MSMSRYKELLKEYLAQPSGSPPNQDLSDKLEHMEKAILLPSPSQRMGLIEQPNYRPRAYELKHAPGFGEVFQTVPEIDWPQYIGGDDGATLKPFSWYIYRQRYGSCASASLTDILKLHRKIMGLPQRKLNPLFVYGRVNGGVDGGSSLQANLDFMLEYGVCAEDVYGNEHGWRPRPPEEAWEDALRHRITKVLRIRNKEEFGSALLYGLPVYWGYTGHAIVGGAPLDRSRFWYSNQWGSSWGENGWGTSTYNNIYWGYGAYVVLHVTVPEPLESLSTFNLSQAI